MRLYDISKELERIIILVEREAEANDGEVPELLERELNFWQARKEEKISNCAFLIKNLEGQIAAIDPEIKRLQELKRARASKIERLKKYILENLEDGETIELDVLKVAVQKSQFVEITDEDELPDEFIKLERKPMKAEISRDLKAGVAVPGAELRERRNLRLK